MEIKNELREGTMKKLKLISSLLAVSIVVFAGFISASTYSTTKKTVLNSNPVTIVTNYLEAAKSHDVDKAVSILRESGITKEQQKKDLSELLEDPSTRIAEIKDVTLENETSDKATLSVTICYEDGSIIKGPACLEKDNGEYKLKRITADNDVIKEATETDADKG